MRCDAMRCDGRGRDCEMDGVQSVRSTRHIEQGRTHFAIALPSMSLADAPEALSTCMFADGVGADGLCEAAAALDAVLALKLLAGE
jgi:hypothetical protein